MISIWLTLSLQCEYIVISFAYFFNIIQYSILYSQKKIAWISDGYSYSYNSSKYPTSNLNLPTTLRSKFILNQKHLLVIKVVCIFMNSYFRILFSLSIYVYNFFSNSLFSVFLPWLASPRWLFSRVVGCVYTVPASTWIVPLIWKKEVCQ